MTDTEGRGLLQKFDHMWDGWLGRLQSPSIASSFSRRTSGQLTLQPIVQDQKHENSTRWKSIRCLVWMSLSAQNLNGRHLSGSLQRNTGFSNCWLIMEIWTPVLSKRFIKSLSWTNESTHLEKLKYSRQSIPIQAIGIWKWTSATATKPFFIPLWTA